MVRYRLSGHRPGPHRSDDRELSQRTGVARDEPQRAPPRWPCAGWAHRRVAGRGAPARPAGRALSSCGRKTRPTLRLIAATSLALLCACAPSHSEQETIRFWVMGREGEVIVQLLPEFERSTPGVRVELQQVPWSAAHEKLLTAF